MRVCVCGSINIAFEDCEHIIKDWLLNHPVLRVNCGMARGVDLHTKLIADRLGLLVIEYPADWNNLGKAAGCIRNERMALDTDAVLAIWDGSSRGTKHMIDYCTKLGIPVDVVTLGN